MLNPVLVVTETSVLTLGKSANYNFVVIETSVLIPWVNLPATTSATVCCDDIKYLIINFQTCALFGRTSIWHIKVCGTGPTALTVFEQTIQHGPQ